MATTKLYGPINFVSTRSGDSNGFYTINCTITLNQLDYNSSDYIQLELITAFQGQDINFNNSTNYSRYFLDEGRTWEATLHDRNYNDDAHYLNGHDVIDGYAGKWGRWTSSITDMSHPPGIQYNSSNFTVTITSRFIASISDIQNNNYYLEVQPISRNEELYTNINLKNIIIIPEDSIPENPTPENPTSEDPIDEPSSSLTSTGVQSYKIIKALSLSDLKTSIYTMYNNRKLLTSSQKTYAGSALDNNNNSFIQYSKNNINQIGDLINACLVINDIPQLKYVDLNSTTNDGYVHKYDKIFADGSLTDLLEWINEDNKINATGSSTKHNCRGACVGICSGSCYNDSCKNGCKTSNSGTTGTTNGSTGCKALCAGGCYNLCGGCYGMCEDSSNGPGCDECHGGCAGCRSNCEGCTDYCKAGCGDTCGGGCSTACSTECGSGCYNGCTGSCYNTCNNACQDECKNGCAIGCVNGCYGSAKYNASTQTYCYGCSASCASCSSTCKSQTNAT